MSITAERKTELIGEYKQTDNDTGSPEVQVAILTSRIVTLTDHFKEHKKRQPFPTRPAENGQPAAAFVGLPEA